MKKLLIGYALLALSAAPAAIAGPVIWTDWTSATVGMHGSAQGNLGSIGITYRGDINFAQLGSGTNYWIEGTPAPYTGSSVIDNAPTASEMVAVSRTGQLQTITFSEAVTNPIMAILSMGSKDIAVTYTFSSPFTLLSEGKGFWGDGIYSLGSNSLTGLELHGAIQFIGEFTSISWKTDRREYWHGFTFGIPDQAASVPVPSTLLLAVLAFLGAGFAAKKRRR